MRFLLHEISQWMHQSANRKDLDAKFKLKKSRLLGQVLLFIFLPSNELLPPYSSLLRIFYLISIFERNISLFNRRLLSYFNIGLKYSESIFISRSLFNRRLGNLNQNFQVPAVRKNKQPQIATKIRAKSTHSLDICCRGNNNLLSVT